MFARVFSWNFGLPVSLFCMFGLDLSASGSIIYDFSCCPCWKSQCLLLRLATIFFATVKCIYPTGKVKTYRKVNSDLPALLDEWATSLFRELDYVREAQNGVRFKKLYGELEVSCSSCSAASHLLSAQRPGRGSPLADFRTTPTCSSDHGVCGVSCAITMYGGGAFQSI